MADRRPLRFWQPFNDWWRTELEKLGRRPNAQEIMGWYHSNAFELWGEEAPSIQETRVHAKCLRSLPLVRDYFRNYRAKKRHGGDGSDADGSSDPPSVPRQPRQPRGAASARRQASQAREPSCSDTMPHLLQDFAPAQHMSESKPPLSTSFMPAPPAAAPMQPLEPIFPTPSLLSVPLHIPQPPWADAGAGAPLPLPSFGPASSTLGATLDMGPLAPRPAASGGQQPALSLPLPAGAELDVPPPPPAPWPMHGQWGMPGGEGMFTPSPLTQPQPLSSQQQHLVRHYMQLQAQHRAAQQQQLALAALAQQFAAARSAQLAANAAGHRGPSGEHGGTDLPTRASATSSGDGDGGGGQRRLLLQLSALHTQLPAGATSAPLHAGNLLDLRPDPSLVSALSAPPPGGVMTGKMHAAHDGCYAGGASHAGDTPSAAGMRVRLSGGPSSSDGCGSDGGGVLLPPLPTPFSSWPGISTPASALHLPPRPDAASRQDGSNGGSALLSWGAGGPPGGRAHLSTGGVLLSNLNAQTQREEASRFEAGDGKSGGQAASRPAAPAQGGGGHAVPALGGSSNGGATTQSDASGLVSVLRF